MFSTTVQRLLFCLLTILCSVFLLGTTYTAQPDTLPETDSMVQTALLGEPVEPPVVCDAEPEMIAQPAPVELRYAHLMLAISQEERGLMALTVYHESRGEPHDGQRAVAETILNRVLSGKFPDTVKEVVYQDGQFSCAGALLTEAIREPGALANCFDVVDEVLSESEYVIPEYYCFFSTGVPQTSDYIQIGHHYFR